MVKTYSSNLDNDIIRMLQVGLLNLFNPYLVRSHVIQCLHSSGYHFVYSEGSKNQSRVCEIRYQAAGLPNIYEQLMVFAFAMFDNGRCTAPLPKSEILEPSRRP